VAQFLAVVRHFSLLQSFITGAGAHSTFYSVRTSGSFPRIKLLVLEADHLPPSRAKVKSEWTCTSSTPYSFMACTVTLPLCEY